MQGEWTKDRFEALFQQNNLALERAIIVLFKRQTADERVASTTKHSNNQGFTATDAAILTSFARRVNAGYSLTPRQIAMLRRKNKRGYSMLTKYHRQLNEAIVEKQERKAA